MSKGLHAHRTDDRGRDHRHSRRDRDPGLSGLHRSVRRSRKALTLAVGVKASVSEYCAADGGVCPLRSSTCRPACATEHVHGQVRHVDACGRRRHRSRSRTATTPVRNADGQRLDAQLVRRCISTNERCRAGVPRCRLDRCSTGRLHRPALPRTGWHGAREVRSGRLPRCNQQSARVDREAPLRRGFFFWEPGHAERPAAYATIGRRFNNCLPVVLE